jgi:hypothetical protein
VDKQATLRKQLHPEQFEVKALADSGGYTFVISSEEPDLVGDIVVQRGMRPVSDRIPAQVDHSGSVHDLVGYWEHIRVEGNKTLADFIPFPHGASKTADTVRTLLDAGIRMAASIGFRAVDAEPVGKKQRGMRFKESMLLECSIVSVPCHPQALSIAKSFGFDESFFSPQGEGQLPLQARRDAALTRSAEAVKKSIYLLNRRH